MYGERRTRSILPTNGDQVTGMHEWGYVTGWSIDHNFAFF